MTPRERKKLTDVHNWMNFLVNEITVNGDDGSKPIKGIKNILEYDHNINKKQTKAIEDLRDITQAQRAKRDLRRAMNTYLAEHPFAKGIIGIATDRRVLIPIIIALGAYLGIRGF